MIAFLTQPWSWWFSGLVIASIMFTLLFFGKSFGFSSNLRTLCTIAGAGKKVKFFDFNWRTQIWNLVFLVGAILGGFLAKEFFDDDALTFRDKDGSTGHRLTIPYFSEYQQNGVTYRCHPYYRSEIPYYDWCYIRCSDIDDDSAEDTFIIAQILLFYKHPTENTIHAIIHSVQHNTKDEHSAFATIFTMEQEGPQAHPRPHLLSVPVESLDKHALMQRYQEDNEFIWFHIWDQCEWPDCFQSIQTPIN